MQRGKIQIPTAPYLGYGMLYRAKKALGLRASRHRNFLIWKLIRLLEIGKIDSRNLAITSMGKTDGAGSQAMAKFSAMCFAQAYGMEYVHAPFFNLAHAELPNHEWDAAWEAMLQMHATHRLADPQTMHVVGIDEYLENPKLWTQKVVLSELNYHPFCKLAPGHGTEVSKKLRAAFRNTHPARDSSSEFIIGVHVRRGDVSRNDPETQNRFIPNNHITALLDHVVGVVREAGIVPHIHIHSNGSADELSDFSRFPNVRLHAGTPALETFLALANSNILITTRSDFSMLAAVYCEGIIICDSRHRTPLPEWLSAGADSATLAAELKRRLPHHNP